MSFLEKINSNILGKTEECVVPKGVGLIIARQNKKGQLTTDSVVNCDAHYLSISTPVVLQNADLSKIASDKIIYLCGHGNKRKRMISRYSMKQIASMLVEHKYTGNQKIVIASCYSKAKRRGLDFAEELQKELMNLGISAECDALSAGTTLFWSDANKCHVATINPRHSVVSVFYSAQKLIAKEVSVFDLNRDYKNNHSRITDWNKAVFNKELNTYFRLNCNASYQLYMTAIIGLLCLLLPTPCALPVIPMIVSWVLGLILYFSGKALSMLFLLPALIFLFSEIPAIAIIQCIVLILIASIVSAKDVIFRFHAY